MEKLQKFIGTEPNKSSIVSNSLSACQCVSFHMLKNSWSHTGLWWDDVQDEVRSWGGEPGREWTRWGWRNKTLPYTPYLPSKVLHGGEYLVTRLRAEQVQVRTQCATRCNCM